MVGRCLTLDAALAREVKPLALEGVLVMCAGGYRSSIAASLLQRRGIAKVSEVAGGLAAWEAAKLPT